MSDEGDQIQDLYPVKSRNCEDEINKQIAKEN
jgi:hypothetical protein